MGTRQQRQVAKLLPLVPGIVAGVREDTPAVNARYLEHLTRSDLRDLCILLAACVQAGAGVHPATAAVLIDADRLEAVA